VKSLIAVLKSDRWEVARASAASSLGELRTNNGVVALRRAVTKDRSWLVRAYAANALARTGDRTHLTLFLQRLKKDPEPATLPSILGALVELGEEQYLELVIRLLEEDFHWYMVYLRACVVLEDYYIDRGRAVPQRLIQALEQVKTYDAGNAATSAAEDLLDKLLQSFLERNQSDAGHHDEQR
jgi:HEAT repeat protein